MKGQASSRDLPIDRGWAWVICLGSFICMFLMGTSMQALSVLFLELVNEFDSSVTVTSLTVMCFVMSLSVSSVVSTSVLVPMFGERKVIAVAAGLFALCSIGYFLAPNIAVFIVFAAAKGCCVGMIFVPAISLLSFYFDKRRSLATTISNSGICVASIVSPPIIRAITRMYGLRGTFLILSAVELNMVAAGLLMRPVSTYRPVRKDTGLNSLSKTDTGLTTLSKDDSAAVKETSKSKSNKKSSINDIDVKQVLLPSSETRDDEEKTDHIDYNNRKATANGRYYDKRELGNHESVVQSTAIMGSENMTEEIPSSLPNSASEFTRRQSSLSKASSHGSSWSVGHKNVKHASHHESMLSVTSGLEPAVTGVGMQEPGGDDAKGWRSCCCIVILRRIFDPSLFTQWSFRVFLISCIPSATTQYLLQYIPTIAVIKGATKDQAATLLTIIGSVDLCSRLLIGLLADTRVLRPTQIVAIAQICQGVLCQFSRLFDTYEKMIAMVVLMGLFIGTRQSLLAITTIEVVGMEKMARSLSISAMVATLSAASHSPMLSAIMEATHSFNTVLHYVGIALITGAVMILFTPLLERIDARREEKRKSQAQSN